MANIVWRSHPILEISHNFLVKSIFIINQHYFIFLINRDNRITIFPIVTLWYLPLWLIIAQSLTGYFIDGKTISPNQADPQKSFTWPQNYFTWPQKYFTLPQRHHLNNKLRHWNQAWLKGIFQKPPKIKFSKTHHLEKFRNSPLWFGAKHRIGNWI